MNFKKSWKWVTIILVVIFAVVIIGAVVFAQINPSEEEFDPNATVLASGSLKSTADSSRTYHGTVNLVQATDGKYYLYFIDIYIDIQMGHLNNEYIYLSDQENLIRSTDDPGNIVEIGELSQYRGDFSLIIPKTIDPLQYKSVIIYNKVSNRFFFRAELEGETDLTIKISDAVS